MTKTFSMQLLPALALPLLASTAALAQGLTGTAHPDQLADAPAQTDHYVKPTHTGDAPPAPAYKDSFPATAPAPAQPRLLTREAEAPTDDSHPVSPAQTYAPAPAGEARALPPTRPTSAEDAYDGAIVLNVPTRPHELHTGTLLHARLRETLSTKSTPEGAVFTAELLRNVGHGGEVMLPAGSLIRGHVASIHGGKRIGGTASLRLRPETISLPDGTLYRLDAQVTDLEGTEEVKVNDEGTVVRRTHPKETIAVLGGVTGTAAVTGAVIGGGVGAAVGAVVGAGVATAWWLKRDVQETLPAGTDLIFALDQPLAVTPR